MQENSPEGSITSVPETGAVSVEERTEVPFDSSEKAIWEQLDKVRNPTANWTQMILLLAVSLAIFAGLGLRNSPVTFTVTLIGVLLIHELGHYLGMRMFGYRNVRMFFIPFFGAAVSGQRTNAKSHQEAIVTLLGPLPGLCIALVLYVVAFMPGFDREHQLLLVRTAFLFGLINAFNLLPIFPLDGGRLLNQILFSRNRYLEGVFQLLAAFAFIAYALTQKQLVLGLLGYWLLITIVPTFKLNTIAQRLGKQFDHQLPPIDQPIPSELFRAMVSEVRSKLPRVTAAKGIANVTYRIWEKMHVQSPGRTATLALLSVYLLAVTATIAVPAIVVVSSSRLRMAQMKANNTWTTVVSDPEKFTVEMPGSPKRHVRLHQSPDGETSVAMYTYDSEDGIAAYSAGFMPRPSRVAVQGEATVAKMLDDGLNIQLSKAKGRLLSRSTISLGKAL